MSKTEILSFLRNKLNHRVFSRDQVLNLHIESGEQIGYITPPCLKILQKFPDYFQIKPDIVVLHGKCFNSRTVNMANFAEIFLSKWDVLSKNLGFSTRSLGWRNELYTAYKLGENPANFTEKIFELERSLFKFLGIETYGVHVNCYTIINKEIFLWIGKRSPTKSRFPNMIDQCVAGE